jgi:hypothetical protein
METDQVVMVANYVLVILSWNGNAHDLS